MTWNFSILETNRINEFNFYTYSWHGFKSELVHISNQNKIESQSQTARTRAMYTRRVKTQYNISWLKKELSMVHGTLYNFFRNKTFLFVKIESWNFQQLFDLGFRETLQNFSSFRQNSDSIFLQELRVVWMSWNTVWFHEIINQWEAENFRFLSWQTKTLYHG